MNPWLESAAVLLLAAMGVGIGCWLARQKTAIWLLGYCVPLLLACLVGLARRHTQWEFMPPFSLLVAGRTEFALAGFITCWVLTIPLQRGRHNADGSVRPHTKGLVFAFMALVVFFSSIWPFLAPAFNRAYLASLRNIYDADGICRQSNDYSCGPAAAVTALREVGIVASEGEIAILAHTSSAIGTPPDLLQRALNKRYHDEGLRTEYRHFDTIPDLGEAGVALVVVKFGWLVDHYVVILHLTDNHVTVADPFLGKVVYARADFLKKWRRTGIILKRPHREATDYVSVSSADKKNGALDNILCKLHFLPRQTFEIPHASTTTSVA